MHGKITRFVFENIQSIIVKMTWRRRLKYCIVNGYVLEIAYRYKKMGLFKGGWIWRDDVASIN